MVLDSPAELVTDWHHRERGWRADLAAVAAILLGLTAGAVILGLAGVSPLAVYGAMVTGAFGSVFGISQVLIVLAPLLTIAIGLALCYRGGIWNIGAEGQLYVGALTGGAAAILLPVAAPPLLIPLALVVGAAGGLIWGWIVGVLKARWSVNEVITSLLLNYVAIFLFSYAIRVPLREEGGFLPQSPPVPKAGILPVLPEINVHIGALLALALVPLLAYVMNRTPFGFQVKATGLNADAAEAAGIDTGRMTVRLMMLSGGLAGLAGVVQILGVQFRLQNGISPGFGFTAIAVALLGRMRPLGILAAAVFMSALTVGGQAMQVTQGIPISMVHTIEALFILFMLVADKMMSR